MSNLNKTKETKKREKYENSCVYIAIAGVASAVYTIVRAEYIPTDQLPYMVTGSIGAYVTSILAWSVSHQVYPENKTKS